MALSSMLKKADDNMREEFQLDSCGTPPTKEELKAERDHDKSIREKFENDFYGTPPTKEELKAERDSLLKNNGISREQLYRLADSNLLSREGYFLFSEVQNLDFILDSLFPDED